MKKLNITWNGVNDTTGYLFSFAKSLSAVLKNSPYEELSEDIIASSGFAFRMWVAADLCPSATSIWSFDCQKTWLENGGLICDYVGRYWDQDDIEEVKRLEAIENIKRSIDCGIAAISWDIGVPEWGLIIGYDDETQFFVALSVTGSEIELSYDSLGKREIPMLNVVTIKGRTNKNQEDIINDTLKLAVSHLRGEEWCENYKGFEAYPALIAHFEKEFNPSVSWNMEYCLGTYAALKWYGWKFFEKYKLSELSELYKKVFDCWWESFNIKKSCDLSNRKNSEKIAKLLNMAFEYERQVVQLLVKKIR